MVEFEGLTFYPQRVAAIHVCACVRAETREERADEEGGRTQPSMHASAGEQNAAANRALAHASLHHAGDAHSMTGERQPVVDLRRLVKVHGIAMRVRRP